MARRMTKNEAEALATRIVHFYENAGGRSVPSTSQHFMAEGIGRRTITTILKRCLARGTTKQRKRGGRRAKIATPKKVLEVERLLTNNPSTSKASGASKLGLKPSTFSFIKVEKLGIRAFTKKSAPKYVKDQKKRAKTNCRKIWREKLLSKPDTVLVLDDETWVINDPTQVPGRDFFHSRNPAQVSVEQRIKPKEKHPEKFLVWQAVDECGHLSKPYVSKGTMTAEKYRVECLVKRLIPFIRKYHPKKNVLFWPDMARVHYSVAIRKLLSGEKIDFVDWKENAPAVPQARPIEKLWALMKREYKRRKKPARDLISFRRIWKELSAKVAAASAQTVMSEARKNLRAIAYGGVYAPLG